MDGRLVTVDAHRRDELLLEPLSQLALHRRSGVSPSGLPGPDSADDSLDLVFECLRMRLELQPQLDQRALDTLVSEPRLDRSHGGHDLVEVALDTVPVAATW
jgi:hypothetical protein